jgi:DNA-binding HxlR family transcriptional regulator
MSLEIFGDRWSLLLIRDMMVRGYETFGEFLNAGEGIASNVLADRLRRLKRTGMVTAERSQEDARRIHYRLTDKGIAFAPVLLELLIWAAHHEDTAAPCQVIAHMETNRVAVLAETQRRWQERDRTPILPPFTAPTGAANGPEKRSRKGSQS